jgi:hypothetical protein
MALRLGFVLAFLSCSVQLLAAQVPSARAWSDSGTFLLGDPVTVHVEIRHPEKLALSHIPADTLGVFHILSRGPLRSASPTVTSTTFTVSAYDSGTAILPPISFLYSVPGDSAPHTVATNPLIFRVHLVEVDTAKDIKDLKPPLSVPITVAEISALAGIVVALVLLAYAIYQYSKRRKSAKPEEVYVPPPKLAHVLALEELAQLKEKRLWQQGLIKPFYSEVTEIVRRYFENRFGFMSLEKTTDETMDDLRRFPAAYQVLEETDRILRRADLVKFAKYQPAVSEHEEMLAAAFDIIDKTKVTAAQTTAADTEVGEAAHA